MSTWIDRKGESRAAVADALKRSASRVSEAGAAAWAFTLSNGTRLAAEARIEEDWLHLEAPLKVRRHVPEVWELARRNGELEGAARFALKGDQDSFSLRADLPLLSAEVLEPLIRETCRGLCHGASIWKGRTRLDTPPAVLEGDGSKGEGAVDGDAPDLAALCEEARWSSREGERGARHVDLEAERGVYHATLMPREGGGTSAVAELARLGALEPLARRAVAVLLLTASASVRLARPMLHESQGETVVVVEVQLAGRTRAESLHRALAALSTFGWLCGPEIVAVSDPLMAAPYLEMRGWSS